MQRAANGRRPSPAADFLHHLKTKFPFLIKAIQIDGGSEFKDQFEEACKRLEITLFVNTPKCPEMNGGVEENPKVPGVTNVLTPFTSSTALFVSSQPEKILIRYPEYGAVIVNQDGRVYSIGKKYHLTLIA
ncbi:MAG TPA: hypothetical protein VHP61_01740 [Acidobacteriota bacterium]|nr:hypothetical protein [Acidobacteriota bacterium]